MMSKLKQESSDEWDELLRCASGTPMYMSSTSVSLSGIEESDFKPSVGQPFIGQIKKRATMAIMTADSKSKDNFSAIGIPEERSTSADAMLYNQTRSSNSSFLNASPLVTPPVPNTDEETNIETDQKQKTKTTESKQNVRTQSLKITKGAVKDNKETKIKKEIPTRKNVTKPTSTAAMIGSPKKTIPRKGIPPPSRSNPTKAETLTNSPKKAIPKKPPVPKFSTRPAVTKSGTTTDKTKTKKQITKQKQPDSLQARPSLIPKIEENKEDIVHLLDKIEEPKITTKTDEWEQLETVIHDEHHYFTHHGEEEDEKKKTGSLRPDVCWKCQLNKDLDESHSQYHGPHTCGKADLEAIDSSASVRKQVLSRLLFRKEDDEVSSLAVEEGKQDSTVGQMGQLEDTEIEEKPKKNKSALKQRMSPKKLLRNSAPTERVNYNVSIDGQVVRRCISVSDVLDSDPEFRVKLLDSDDDEKCAGNLNGMPPRSISLESDNTDPKAMNLETADNSRNSGRDSGNVSTGSNDKTPPNSLIEDPDIIKMKSEPKMVRQTSKADSEPDRKSSKEVEKKESTASYHAPKLAELRSATMPPTRDNTFEYNDVNLGVVGHLSLEGETNVIDEVAEHNDHTATTMEMEGLQSDGHDDDDENVKKGLRYLTF